jgi:hypothetical protein
MQRQEAHPASLARTGTRAVERGAPATVWEERGRVAFLLGTDALGYDIPANSGDYLVQRRRGPL